MWNLVIMAMEKVSFPFFHLPANKIKTFFSLHKEKNATKNHEFIVCVLFSKSFVEYCLNDICQTKEKETVNYI